MASIVQDPNQTNDPNYLGSSQGTDKAKPNTSMGDLFSGIATLGGGVIKAAAGFQANKIQSDVQAGVDRIRNDAGVGDAADMAADGIPPTQMRGDAGNYIFDAPGRVGQGNPAGVSRYGSRLNGLQAKYDRGELSESYYNAKLLALTKEVKAQHSGWDQEIDGMIKSITGKDPANALVTSLRNDMDAAERARQGGASKIETEIHSDIKYALPATQEKLIRGDRSPETLMKFRTETTRAKSREFQVQSEQHELTLKNSRGEYNEKETLKVGQSTVDHYVNKAFTNMTSASGGIEGIMTKIQASGDKPFTPDEQAKIKADFSNFRSQTLLGVESILSSEAYTQLPQEKKKAIVAGVTERIAHVEQALLNKDTGALTRDAAYVESLGNADQKAFLERYEFARKGMAISKTFGVAAPDVLKGYTTSPGGMKEFQRTVTDLDSFELMGGTAGSLKKQTERRLQEGNNLPTLLDPKMSKVHIDNAVTGLTKSTDPVHAENYAKAMFGPDNVGFLNLYQPKNQQQVFRQLTQPSVDRKMMEIGGELYQNYRNWVVNYGFKSQVKRSLDTINEIHGDSQSLVSLRVDESSGVPQFVASPLPKTAGVYRNKMDEEAAMRRAEDAVRDINENIRIIDPILKREGKASGNQVLDVLQTSGWNPNAPKKPGILGQMGEAISNFLTGTEEKPVEAAPLEYKFDNPGGRVKKDPSTQGTLIDMDAGGLQAIGAKSEGIKNVILKAESDGNYDLVYGTKRKIPVTKMTLNEIDSLQTSMKKGGAPSTAIGGFQFLQSTLRELKTKLGLSGDEVFNKALQNKLADALLQRRGFGEYLQGGLGHKELVDRLAMEWAGLPNTKGKSHYEGDGLNHANTPLRPVLDELKKLRVAGDDNQ